MTTEDTEITEGLCQAGSSGARADCRDLISGRTLGSDYKLSVSSVLSVVFFSI